METAEEIRLWSAFAACLRRRIHDVLALLHSRIVVTPEDLERSASGQSVVKLTTPYLLLFNTAWIDYRFRNTTMISPCIGDASLALPYV